MKSCDLDGDFLRYFGGDAQVHQYIHGYYAPFFNGSRRVVDLACGQGDFVKVLGDAGIPALGVDLDPTCVADARAQGGEIVHQDVFEFLDQVSPGSIDGIFCAHLVEHLSYERVLRLLELSYQALGEGGIIVLTTPNVRALYTHLESFYLHFGHVSFYHPQLLCFFLNHVGFCNPREGENPRLARPLWGRNEWALSAQQATAAHTIRAALAYEQVIPCPTRNPGRQLIWHLKRWAVQMVVQPYIDRVATHLSALNDRIRTAENLLTELDRSVECYAFATKGDRQVHIPQA